MKSYFPDVNVWLALAYRGHQHHPIASAWFEGEAEEVIFCRFTQLSFLRLLTHPAIMRDEVKTQQEAWKAYDQLSGDARVSFFTESEPQRVEAALRALTASSHFPISSGRMPIWRRLPGLRGLTLVTFDKALGKLAGKECVLLA